MKLSSIDRSTWERMTAGLPRTKLTNKERTAAMAAAASVAAGETFSAKPPSWFKRLLNWLGTHPRPW
jgi:hypothetical protein